MDCDKPIAAIVAHCDGNRGIGKDGNLPWPYLKEDLDYYVGLCRTTKDPKKKNGMIMGKDSWKTWPMEYRIDPQLPVIITSTTMKTEPHCYGIARSFDEAVRMFCAGPDKDSIETIYNLGGRRNYECAVSDPRCSRLYITRIFKDFDSDVFFPDYEHAFHAVRDPEIDDRIREDETIGIKFRFEVWERNL